MTKNVRAEPPLGTKESGTTAAKRRRSDTANADAQPHIGKALKSVYDRTVDEAIPSEMLDLLGRLG